MERRSTGPRGARAAAVGLCFAVALHAACGGGEPTAPEGGGGGSATVASVEVTPAADTLTAIGGTVELSARALDGSGNEVSGVSFTWSSSDEAVVTVDGSGVAEAVEEGEAEVTATADGVSGSAEVAVVQEVASVAVRPSSVTLTAVGDTQTFTATTQDANGYEVSGVDVTWASSDTAVATVDADGLARARADGEAMITAAVGDGVVGGEAEIAVNQAIHGLAFRTEPSDAMAGEVIDPPVQVEVVDVHGHVVADAAIPVTIGLAQNPAERLGGQLHGTTTVAAVEGVATFGDLWLSRAATGYALAAAGSGGMSGATSVAFDIAPAEAEGLEIVQHPLPDQVAGTPLREAVIGLVVDAYGNPVRDATGPITAELAHNPTGAALSGLLAVEPVDGSARFEDLVVETAGAGYTLRLRAEGLASVTTNAFDVTAAEPAGLAFVAQPTDISGLHAFDPPVQVAVEDEFGNRVESSTADVNLTFATDPSGGRARLSGGTAVSVEASEGIATFDLFVDVPGQDYTLEAQASGLTRATSASFSVHLSFAGIGVVENHACGVTEGVDDIDPVYCWGRNHHGQLGDGTTDDSPLPVVGLNGIGFATVSVGRNHTCGLTTGGAAYCWGQNDDGELGDGTLVDRHSPVAVGGGLIFASISAGFHHTCGVTTDHRVFCWGTNDVGELGDGTTVDRTTPVAVSSTEPFADVSAADAYTCAVTGTHKAYCWGHNTYGNLGDGSTDDRSTPTLVDTDLRFTGISAGASHTCAVATDGAAYCWGKNSSGQLGDGTNTSRSRPVAVDVSAFPGFTFAPANVRTGAFHTCGIADDGRALCWGANARGELGDGTTSLRTTPVAVSGDLTFAEIDAGWSITCGLTTSGNAYCWGKNPFGQLGDGTTLDRSTPTLVVQ